MYLVLNLRIYVFLQKCKNKEKSVKTSDLHNYENKTALFIRHDVHVADVFTMKIK